MAVATPDGIDFTGKVAIVTGASSGIGAATAKALAARGAKLTLIGRNEPRLTTVAEYCEAASGNKPLCLLLDLTSDSNCNDVALKTFQTFARIDVLINCAGKTLMSSLFDTSMDIFDDLLALNLRVPYRMTQVCVPYLRLTKGNVVNVFGSPAKIPGFLPYFMIMNALDSFTKCGASELASVGVRMNAVRPGITRTNFLVNLNVDEDNLEHAYSCVADMMPNCKILEPEEVANMIIFVASDVCPNLNGSGIILAPANQE